MLNIVCVKWGTLYSAAYVNVLFDMCRRNLMEGYPGKFICYTDDPEGLDPGIEARELPKELEGWWGKLWLFKQHTEGRTLFFDLDTVIVGALDHIADYSGPFAILRDFYRPNGLQSSVMVWNGDHSYIWDCWEHAGRPRCEGGDQAWIETIIKPKHDILQDKFPGDFVSYKASGCQQGFKNGAKVVVFHGIPRPHEVTDGWVPKVWKVGGGTTAELMVVSNVPESKILENRDVNSSRGLPELAKQEPNQKVATIVAGGPSLSDSLGELKSLGADIFSVNGTLRFLSERGIHPEYQVMLDARPENAEFLTGDDVHYMMCSQVDPSLLDKLEGKKVTLWHSALPGAKPKALQIGGSTTVGLKAAILAYVLGYREIHLFGFDSCYRGDYHHAYSQSLNDGERVITVTVGDEEFKCAPWMAQQAKEFGDVAPELVRMGCEIHVHGDGLIPAIAANMSAPRIAADDRAEAIMERLPSYPVVGAEIGVFAGDLSRRLLQRWDLTLYMVDAWAGNGDSYEGDSGDFHASLTQAQQDGFMEQAKSVTAFAGSRANVIKAFSHEAANRFTDGSLDFVFIDADHGYEGCKRDLEAWWPKVKAGGLFSGHDYENTKFPKFGVKRAVDEFAQKHGLTVELGANFTWFITRP